jgi:hypothetical protein
MTAQHRQTEKYARAQERVTQIKKFYKHLIFYVMINFFFIGRRIYIDISSGLSFEEVFTDISTFYFFFWWGVLVIVHAAKVFGFHSLFNKDWENRKMKEYMNKKDFK